MQLGSSRPYPRLFVLEIRRYVDYDDDDHWLLPEITVIISKLLDRKQLFKIHSFKTI